MSLFSVQARKHTAYYDHLVSTSRTPGRDRPTDRKPTDTTQGKSERTSAESVCDESRSSDKSHAVNRTYVISAVSKSGGGQQTPYRARLTLQRRSRRKTGAEATDKMMTDSSHNSTPAPEKRLTLQRRTRTPSMDKGVCRQREVVGTGLQQTPKVLSEPNGRAHVLIRSASLKDSRSKSKERDANAQWRLAHSKTPSSCYLSSTNRQLEEQAQTFKTPTKKTPFEKIAAKRDVFERLAQKEAPKAAAVKSASLERSKSRVQREEKTPVPAPRVSKVCTGVQRQQVAKTSTYGQKGEATQDRTSTPAPAPAPTVQQLSRASEALKLQDAFKMENSAVTVAVRVRPFNARWVRRCSPPLILVLQREKHKCSSEGFILTLFCPNMQADFPHPSVVLVCFLNEAQNEITTTRLQQV